MYIDLATIDDIPELCLLLAELFAIENFIANPEKQEKGLQHLIESADACVIVARYHKKAIAMSTAQLLFSTVEGAPSMVIEDLIVASSHRGKGIGKALLQHTKEWGQQRGCSRAQLLADRHNTPALKFYSALGWNTTELICLHRKIV